MLGSGAAVERLGRPLTCDDGEHGATVSLDLGGADPAQQRELAQGLGLRRRDGHARQAERSDEDQREREVGDSLEQERARQVPLLVGAEEVLMRRALIMFG